MVGGLSPASILGLGTAPGVQATAAAHRSQPSWYNYTDLIHFAQSGMHAPKTGILILLSAVRFKLSRARLILISVFRTLT